MNTSCPLPKFFAIKRDNSYKLYENKVFKPVDTMIINIISNHNSISNITMSKYYIIQRMNTSVLRKYYGGFNNECTWTYTGYEFLVNNTNNDTIFAVPVIIFPNSSDTLLPHGSDLFSPSDPVEYIVSEASIYESSNVFNTDPYEIDNLPVAPVARPPVARPPVARPPVARPPVARPPISQPHASSVVSFPVHVKQIIIADSVSKKESCPIAGIDIDRTNASVTSCGHVFTTDAITQWLSMSTKKECPICKQKCSI